MARAALQTFPISIHKREKAILLSSFVLNWFFFVLYSFADERFPEYGKVEFVFSYGPEKIKGKAEQKVQTLLMKAQYTLLYDVKLFLFVLL